MTKRKKSRNSRRIKVESDFIGRHKTTQKVEYEKLIDNRRDEVEEALIIKNKDFRKFNLIAKADDIKKDKNIISNKSFRSLKGGFMLSSDKEKYISQNKEHIKRLQINEQRNLMKLFLMFL